GPGALDVPPAPRAVLPGRLPPRRCCVRVMTASSPNPYTRRPTLIDRAQLWIVKLAKLRRRGFANEAGAYEDFYEEFFEARDGELSGAARRPVQRGPPIADAIRRPLPQGASILDVGCGLGDVLQMLPSGYRLHGMEYAKSNVERASKRLGDRAVIKE